MTATERFQKAARQEMKEWNLSKEEQALLLPFLVCVAERIEGREPMAWVDAQASCDA
jgi:hypothetical protein